jgi:REP element-mobilizing transposase RayT
VKDQRASVLLVELAKFEAFAVPVYLFTYHAYCSWMPDRQRGFVRRHEGILPPNRALSNIYKRQTVDEEVKFNAQLQRLLIDELVTSCVKQNWRLHFVATTASHVHTLVSWRSAHTWKQVRVSLKSSLSRRFNKDQGRRRWFSEGASRKRIQNKSHFDYLVSSYLPQHRGWKWQEKRGFFR